MTGVIVAHVFISYATPGRRVRDVEVLERIADGLGVPRAWLRLGYGEDEPGASSAEEEVDEQVKRRALITTATGVALGQVAGLGELAEVALPTGRSLPARWAWCMCTPCGPSRSSCAGRHAGSAARPTCSPPR
ncbi:MAG: hypothetical protein M3460_30875 [Actinomycetota bacterium]|nr:hypothetical protein [Actinomycetota bacterium]